MWAAEPFWATEVFPVYMASPDWPGERAQAQGLVGNEEFTSFWGLLFS